MGSFHSQTNGIVSFFLSKHFYLNGIKNRLTARKTLCINYDFSDNFINRIDNTVICMLLRMVLFARPRETHHFDDSEVINGRGSRPSILMSLQFGNEMLHNHLMSQVMSIQLLLPPRNNCSHKYLEILNQNKLACRRAHFDTLHADHWFYIIINIK